MEARSYTRESYRYGFNGQEKDDEVSGAGNSMTGNSGNLPLDLEEEV